MTLEELVTYCRERDVSIRVSAELPGTLNVQIHGRGRLGIADADQFEDAFEMAKLRFEAGWKVKL